MPGVLHTVLHPAPGAGNPGHLTKVTSFFLTGKETGYFLIPKEQPSQVILMTPSIKTYNEAVAFHGHSCPGLALGYRAAEYALHYLRAGRSEDEDLVAVVENDACGVDAIQLVAGCSAGKGNLVFRDFGKHAYTFIDRRSNRAIRLVQRPGPVIQRIDPLASALREKVMAGTATPAEQKEFHVRQAAVIEKILEMPFDELFIVREVKPEIPTRAKLFASVQCALCGEMVAEHRARVKEGKFICIPCAGDEGRGR
jgi:formylmethanofuran dehydrogenase subunit E